MAPPPDRPLEELAVTQSFAGTPGAPRAKPVAEGDAKTEPKVEERSGLYGQRLGPYRVLQQIGSGGMGVVYEARHESIGQRAAVKMLSAELSRRPDFVERFFTEARAATMAQHPGLVKIFDHGQLPGGELYILMEFLDGEPLSRRLFREQNLSESQAMRFTRQIADAMAAVHEKGIVHREVLAIDGKARRSRVNRAQRRRSAPIGARAHISLRHIRSTG